MELINVVKKLKGQDFINKNNSFNTSLYIIKIYCPKCSGACLKESNCKIENLEYDFVLYNDNSHCINL